MKKFFCIVKNFFIKFATNKNTNAIVSTCIELPILIIGIFVTKNYNFAIFGVLIYAIINFLIQKSVQKILIKKIKNSPNLTNLAEFFEDFKEYQVDDRKLENKESSDV